MKIGVIDYGAGNLRSVCNTLDALGAERSLVAGAPDLGGIDFLIFPGVGAFGDSTRQLQEQGLIDPLREWLAEDRPFLGICIGFQLLFEEGDESPGSRGLGALRGRVVRFNDRPGLKVPHMGWNAVKPADPADPAWEGLGESPYFYFVHSYFPVPEDGSLLASTTAYGEVFASSVRRGNLFATQFHPEKSQAAGSRLIANLLKAAGG